MNRDKRILYSLLYSLLAFLSLCIFIPTNINKYLLLIVLPIYSFLSLFYIKKRKILSIHKKEILGLITVISVVYIMLFYLLGLKFGFHKTLYPLTTKNFFVYILPTIIIIISIELIRYVFVIQDDYHAKIISYIVCIIADYLMIYNIYSFTSLNIAMDIIGITLLPSITFNILYHFLSNNYGFYPNIISKLITGLYVYILPISPLLPESLKALGKLLFPLVVLWFVKLLYHTTKKEITRKTKIFQDVSFIIIIVLMISLMMLVSNKFRFGTVVIATNSMKDEISSGDAVIYKRLDDDDIVLKDQIIVFEKNDTLIIHRVSSIEYINGELHYYTKGDNNEELDSGYITRSNIKGIVKMKIAYVGYPTLWLTELFAND